MSIEKNLSALTTISEDNIKYLSKYLKYVHSHEIATQMQEGSSNTYELELFEGKLLIQIIDDSVSYKFIPNEQFNSIVTDTILNKKSLLVDTMANRVKSIFSKAYKDVL